MPTASAGHRGCWFHRRRSGRPSKILRRTVLALQGLLNVGGVIASMICHTPKEPFDGEDFTAGVPAALVERGFGGCLERRQRLLMSLEDKIQQFLERAALAATHGRAIPAIEVEIVRHRRLARQEPLDLAQQTGLGVGEMTDEVAYGSRCLA